jgi:type VI secretion system protein ImpF
MASVVDRLIEQPAAGGSSTLDRDVNDVAQQVRNVARDLENLLNTRRRFLVPPSEYKELNASIVEYGIPDFTGLNMTLPSEREQTRRTIERAIRQFEPRLRNVVVTVLTNIDKADRRLRLRIAGVLRSEPVPERVEFDSEVDPSTTTVSISNAHR